ncbi:MAG: hypothetical protein Q9169_002764 [Polycauliona sp. 2 TL-2023]
MIYKEALPNPRPLPTCQDFRAIYEEDLRTVWTDRPSSFLFLNKQIQAEFSILLGKSELCLNVTGRGIILDEAGMSVSIAQKACQNLENVSHLRIDVWPPRQDRPVEMLYIWKGLQELRNKIVECSRLQKLTLTFKNKGLCKWLDSDIYSPESPRRSPGSPRNIATFTSLLDLFASVTNIKHVQLKFANTIGCSQLPGFQALREHALTVADVMIGHSKPFTPINHFQTQLWSTLEWKLKKKTARLALQKLCDLTDHSATKLAKPVYNSIVKRWPYFETLRDYDEFEFEHRYCDMKPPSIRFPLRSRDNTKELIKALARLEGYWQVTAIAEEEDQPIESSDAK